MIPVVVHFVTRTCPVCFSSKHKLKVLEIRGDIQVLEVDVEAAGQSDLIDKYRYFIRRAFGGRAEVPVVLLLRENRWYVPVERSRVGGPVSYSSRIEKATTDMVKDILEDIRHLKTEDVSARSHEEILNYLMGGVGAV